MFSPSHHPLTFSLEEALQIANDMYQEVHSKDGISRPIADQVELSANIADIANPPKNGECRDKNAGLWMSLAQQLYDLYVFLETMQTRNGNFINKVGILHHPTSFHPTKNGNGDPAGHLT